MGIERARKREIMCYPTSVVAAAGNHKSTPRKVKAISQRNRLPISPASTSISAAAAAANDASSSSSSLSSLTTKSNAVTTAIATADTLSPSRSPNERVNSSSSPRIREKNHSPILKVLFSALFVNPCAPSSSASASQVSHLKKKHRHIRRESRDDYLEGQDENPNQDSSSSSPSSVILPIEPRVLIYQKEAGGSTDEEEEELCQQQQEEEQQRIRRQIQMQQTLPLPSLDHHQGQQERERARCLLSSPTAAAAPSSISVAAVAAPVTSMSTSTKKVPVPVPVPMNHPFFLREIDEHKVEEELWRQHQERQWRKQQQQQQSLPLPSLDHQVFLTTTTTTTTPATTASITDSSTIAPPTSDAAPATSTSSSTSTKKVQQQQQQEEIVVGAKQQQQVKEQPFFLLDHLIDDLIPNDHKDQDHQDSYRESLAELFLNQDNGYTSFNTAKKSASTSKYTPNKSSRSMMRRTQSCTVGGCKTSTNTSNSSSSTSSSSPIPGCLFWSSLPWSKDITNTSNNNLNDNTNVRSSKKAAKDSSRQASSSSSSLSSSLPLSLPATPKSSNRRACRLGRQIENEYDYEYECKSNSKLLVPPMRHQDQASSKLDDIATTTNRTRTTSDITASTTCSSSSESLATLGSPSVTSGEEEEDVASCSSRTITRTSSMSCPQFVDKNATTPTTKLSRRRQEQLDRRERRSKFTVVQRSLTLAQGWNSKGLLLASKATQAEAEQQAEALLLEEEKEGGTEMDHSSHQEHEKQEKENIFGLWSHALHCWNDSLQIYSSLLGNSHERVADVQNNRGLALGKLNQYKYAQQAFQQALTIHQQRLVRVQKIKRTHRDTEKQRLLRKIQHGSLRSSKASASSSEEATIVCAIVSTLHNTSNMYREAGEPYEAIRVLSEGQLLLETSIIGPLEQQTIMMDHENDTENNTTTTTTTTITYQHYFQYYQLLARLYTAIGHIYYYMASDSNGNDCDNDNDNGDDDDDIESESLQESKMYYQNALHVYEKLLMKCTTSTSSCPHRSATQDSNPDEEEEEEQQQYQQQHRELLQQEIQLLQQDIHELNRCCQEGSRRRRRRGRGQGGKEQQRQQQKKQTSSSFFTFIRNLRST